MMSLTFLEMSTIFEMPKAPLTLFQLIHRAGKVDLSALEIWMTQLTA